MAHDCLPACDRGFVVIPDSKGVEEISFIFLCLLPVRWDLRLVAAKSVWVGGRDYGNITLLLLADLSVLVQISGLEKDGSTFLSVRFNLKYVEY